MYRIVGICWFSFVLLCFGAIAIGHEQPTSSFIPEIGKCGDTLCFLGIQAGVTTLNDGNASLDKATQLPYDASNDYWTMQHNSQPYLQVRLASAFGSEIIDTVNIGYNLNDGRVGDVINRFGMPCSVELTEFETVLVYPKIAFRFWNKEYYRLRLDSQLRIVVLFELSTRKTICEPDPLKGTFHWKGFRFYP